MADLIARLERNAEVFQNTARDLRAAAEAVRLLGECKVALMVPNKYGGIRHREDEHEVCHDWCPACKVDNVIAKIAAWEAAQG